MKDALIRFRSKCRFEAGSGCVVWTGATSKSRAGTTPAPAFWASGKRWPARRWAAIHVHGLTVAETDNVVETCGEPLCVQHVAVEPCTIGRNYERQNYLLRGLGYGDEEDRVEKPRPRHTGEPFYRAPSWLEPVRVTRELAGNCEKECDGAVPF